MHHANDEDSITSAGSALADTVPLAEVRADLARLEALHDEVAHRLTLLRAALPPEQFRLVWALLDAQERLGLVERLLAGHAVSEVR